MLAYHHQLIVLVECLHEFGHQSKSWLFMVLFIFYSDGDTYGIIDKYRFEKAEPLIAIGHSYFVDKVSSETNGNSKDERTMCNPFFERLCLAPFFVHMMWEKVAGLSGMYDYISF